MDINVQMDTKVLRNFRKGDLVFLKVTQPLTPEQMGQIQLSIGPALKRSGIAAIVLDHTMEVVGQAEQDLSTDTARLDFMIEHNAFFYSKKGDADNQLYQLVRQTHDDDLLTLSEQDRWFMTPRDAIDSAVQRMIGFDRQERGE